MQEGRLNRTAQIVAALASRFRFGLEAEVKTVHFDVCFTPESGHWPCLSGFFLTLFLIPLAQAQVTIDASKITCDQFVHGELARREQAMHSNVIRMFSIITCIIGTVSLAYAQQNVPAGQIIDTGKDDYNSHCASCHGVSGAGDGPHARLLNVTVPNLTTLSKRNGGKFPYSQVLGTIDGRFELPAHGTRNMPIWGQEFIYKANPRNPRPEDFVRAKIRDLVLYISRLQAK